MNSTIKKLLLYFLVRDFLLILIVDGFTSKETVTEFISHILSELLAYIVFYVPLIIFNALLFGVPYFYLLKRVAEGGKRAVYIWYGAGLLLLEARLLAFALYNLPMWASLPIFMYLLAFTWIFFRSLFEHPIPEINKK